MVSKSQIAVLLGPGTNCHEETAYAIDQSGRMAEIVVIQRLADNPSLLMDYEAVVVPGGFSWGDHFGSGRAFALMFGDALRQFAATGRPMLGICNGFQVLMEVGLFDHGEVSGGALVQNLSGKFESRSSCLMPVSGSPWTEGYEGNVLRMPVAHAEGRWLVKMPSPSHLKMVFLYCDPNRNLVGSSYPANPNGSPGGVTGLANGLVMGMMPHPERAIDPDLGSTDGHYIFDALVRLARSHV